MGYNRGKSIQLYLAEGDANGLIVATVPNWAGCLIKGKNADLPALLSRKEAKNAGVYILQGTDSDNIFKSRAYIGQATELKRRISDHAREKDWWDVCVLITTSDQSFSAGHYLSLESKLIQLALDANRAVLENNQSPGETAGNLGEAAIADVESFFDEIKLVLPVIGIDFFKKQIQPSETNEISSNTPSYLNQAFYLNNRKVELGRAMEIEGEFIVLQDSKALIDPGHKTNQYQSHRDKLIEDRVLVERNGFLVFLKDVSFSSPSKAAAVILGRNDNGRTSWKTESGKTYHEWQQERTDHSS